MKILYIIFALFLVEQRFISKQNDYITFKLISSYKKNANTLIPASKKVPIKNKKLCKGKARHDVNKNFNILIKKLQRII